MAELAFCSVAAILFGAVEVLVNGGYFDSSQVPLDVH